MPFLYKSDRWKLVSMGWFWPVWYVDTFSSEKVYPLRNSSYHCRFQVASEASGTFKKNFIKSFSNNLWSYWEQRYLYFRMYICKIENAFQAIHCYNYSFFGHLSAGRFEEPGGVESKSNEFFLDMNYNSPFKESVLNGTKRKFTNHKSSIVFILPPQANATIRVGFTPSSQILTTTRLYLRWVGYHLTDVSVKELGNWANIYNFLVPKCIMNWKKALASWLE